MSNNIRAGVALVAVLAGLLAVVLWVGQTTPTLSVYVDLGGDRGAAPAAALLSPTPAPGATPLAPQPAASPTPPALSAARPTPTLPAPLGTIVRYIVQAGDNLSGIAAQYGTTVGAILARNKITDPNLLFVGSPLQIMVGEQTPALAAVPTASPPGSPAARAAISPTGPPAPAAALVGAATPAPMDALEPTRPAQVPAAYDVYIPTASKTGQYFHFTCEFDAAWAIFKTYGLDVSLSDQLALVGVDARVVPSYKQTSRGIEITGGDIANFYSGDYQTNFLARTTGAAMRKVFAHYGLATTPVHDQAGVEAALRAGQLIWIKTTVDFQRWVPATWIGPDGRRYGTVLGNDHAVVVAGFNSSAVLIRDVLGPTSTNAHRLTEYEVAWPTFLAAWGAQSSDGLAVTPPGGR